jgi:hypothetical protein
MQKVLNFEITNLYGSAQFPREITVVKQKHSRTKKRLKTRSDIGIPVDSSMSETNTETSLEQVNSFKMVDGKPFVRLGGAYSKLCGLFKEAGFTLATAGEDGFTKTGISTIIKSITILPEEVELNVIGDIHEEKGLVAVNSTFGGKGTQKPTIWDVIPKATGSITLIYPDAFDDKIKKVLMMSENLNFAERRRGRIKFSQ